jgi:hypothetical protein
MLNKLKILLEDNKDITDDGEISISDMATDDVKDIFLNPNKDVATLGAENDPTIKKFIDSIPEDDEADPVTDEEIEKITEHMIPITNTVYESSQDEEEDDDSGCIYGDNFGDEFV